MSLRTIVPVSPARAAALALLGAIAGCQAGSNTPENNLAGVDTNAPPPPQEKITQSDLQAFCPSITVREGTAAFNTYAKGGDGDPTKVIYQASISQTTRSCTRADGMMTIKVAVAGRIVPGPMGQAGAITLPIRVAVTQGAEVPYSQLHKHQVTISDTSAATQFLFTDPNVIIPIPPNRAARVQVGFDEGPEKAADD